MKTLRFTVLPLAAVFLLGACERGADYDGPAPYSSRYEALPSAATGKHRDENAHL